MGEAQISETRNEHTRSERSLRGEQALGQSWRLFRRHLVLSTTNLYSDSAGIKNEILCRTNPEVNYVQDNLEIDPFILTRGEQRR